MRAETCRPAKPTTTTPWWRLASSSPPQSFWPCRSDADTDAHGAHVLTIAIFLPVAAAAVLALLPRRLRSQAGARQPADDPWASRLRLIASMVGLVPLLIRLGAWARFDGGGGFELVESSEWIPTLGVGYRVVVAGLTLPLALMTALLFAVAIAYPVDLRGRPDRK